MKKLVWLLILINLGLLAYFNLDLILPNTAKVATIAISPEKIKVLTQQQIEALPKKVVEMPAPVNPALAVDEKIANINTTPATPLAKTSACYDWGVFSSVRVTDAQIAASKLSLQATVKEQTSLEAKRFWVYKPPLKSAEAAQAKALELKALGVEDLFVVQDAKWKNAISFGVFEDEQLATSLLKELKAKGIKDAVKALRNQGKGHASLIFKDLADEKIAYLKNLKSDFPEAELKEISCN
jgi:hypothetical protein